MTMTRGLRTLTANTMPTTRPIPTPAPSAMPIIAPVDMPSSAAAGSTMVTMSDGDVDGERDVDGEKDVDGVLDDERDVDGVTEMVGVLDGERDVDGVTEMVGVLDGDTAGSSTDTPGKTVTRDTDTSSSVEGCSSFVVTEDCTSSVGTDTSKVRAMYDADVSGDA